MIDKLSRAATTQAGEKQKAPPWYSRAEVVDLLRKMKYSDVIAQELADWLVRHLQSAFNKGFQVGQQKYYAPSQPVAPVVADGWALVPKQWTSEMAHAGYLESIKQPENIDCAACGAIYKAMLAAAPHPAQPQPSSEQENSDGN